jgi:hypothetical protein
MMCERLNPFTPPFHQIFLPQTTRLEHYPNLVISLRHHHRSLRITPLGKRQARGEGDKEMGEWGDKTNSKFKIQNSKFGSAIL